MYRYEACKPRILEARTEEALIRVLAEFCAQWPQSQLGRLPPDCRHCEPRTGDEIAELAVAFTTAELRYAEHELQDVLGVMARTFALALQQLQRIRPPSF
jgi:hypothetical protein